MTEEMGAQLEQLIAQGLALRHILRQTLFLLTIRETDADRLALFEEVRRKALGNVDKTIVEGRGLSNDRIAAQTEFFINDFFDRVGR